MNSPTTPTFLAQAADSSSTSDSSGWWFIFGVFLALVAIACVVLFISALVSILRSRSLTTGGKLLWCIAVFVFQFFGPLVWFLWGRNAQVSRPTYPSQYGYVGPR
ncbi:PLD nuclease N-terminal domain-containing protein [Corynebacterium variabile]|uniref:PLD nuclease N-terminal domain-containing protein n=1 Tax=Corynebacterium variabile TaxID=1727 RepID=UPI0028A1A99C|nr:PLD nuclease N-terminal domain-containing protein [Corynebacterium variabile]